jgi:hypothetical protein
MFQWYPSFRRTNVANVNQNNNAFAQNVAIGSRGVNQSITQVQNNEANIFQR